MRFRILLMLCCLVAMSSVLAHNYQYSLPGYAWDERFTETDPPASPVRPIAEFEPSSHVIIRYPLGIPVSLVDLLADTAEVICLVGSNSAMNSASNTFSSAGVNMDKVSFLIAATDSYWTRDFSPWFIYDGNGDMAVVDFRYNRPRPNDNLIPQVYAQHYALPYYGMDLYQTGGNYMTDGINTAAQTTIAYSENSNNQNNVNTLMQQYLGISSYHVLQDPNNTYIDHIDCWGKFLAPDKVLIRSVPTSHAQYDELEAMADYFAGLDCAWGYPYRVYRVNTPNNQPYTNSLILNKKVFVPQMNSSHDEPALQVYRDAMPGYEVIGVSGTYSAPWESTDALHCRTHEVPDSGMLHIAHQPLFGMQPALEEYVFNADISAFSGAELYADSLYIRYRINSEDWQYLGLAHQSAMHYSGILDSFSVGDTIRYFIHAADQSGRSADHPVFAGLDPHLFVVEGDASAPELVHYPLTSIGNEETTFLLVASDDSGINSTGISYRIDQGEIISDAMLDAGNGIYLYPYDPQFYSGDQFFYYRLFAEDTFGNIAYLPSAEDWFTVTIQPVSNADQHSPHAHLSSIIYPNPVRRDQNLTILYHSDKNSEVKVQLFNLRGQLLSERGIPANSAVDFNLPTVDKNGHALASGIYFLRLNQDNNIRNHKLIITK